MFIFGWQPDGHGESATVTILGAVVVLYASPKNTFVNIDGAFQRQTLSYAPIEEKKHWLEEDVLRNLRKIG